MHRLCMGRSNQLLMSAGLSKVAASTLTIAFTRKIDIPIVNIKRIYKLLVEANELEAEFDLIGDVWHACNNSSEKVSQLQ